MPHRHEEVIYEISPKAIFHGGKALLISAIVIMVLALAMFLWMIILCLCYSSPVTSVLDAIFILSFASLACVYGAIFFYSRLLIINQFGIYEKGIAPSMKPKHMRPRHQWVIPYSEIVEIKLKGYQKGKFLRYPFSFILKLKSGEEVEINAEDLSSYIKDINEMKRVYDLLIKVMTELEKDENKIKREQGVPIVLEKSKFKDILTMEYKIAKPWKERRYLKAIPIAGATFIGVGFISILLDAFEIISFPRLLIKCFLYIAIIGIILISTWPFIRLAINEKYASDYMKGRI